MLRLLAAITLIGLSVPAARAQEVIAPEYQVKAAFLYNFAKFADWPANAFTNNNQSFVIVVYGKNPFGRILEETVKGKKIADRNVSVRVCNKLADIGDCHLLFTTESDKERLSDLFTHLANRPTLTVGQSEGFAHRGGMINFIKENAHVRFEINDGRAKAAKLKLSSRLLRLAVIVKSEPR